MPFENRGEWTFLGSTTSCLQGHFAGDAPGGDRKSRDLSVKCVGWWLGQRGRNGVANNLVTRGSMERTGIDGP